MSDTRHMVEGCGSQECRIRGVCTSSGIAHCRNVLSDFSLVAVDARPEPAWSKFLEQMRGRRYGAEATLVAWSWFRDGWSAAIQDHVDAGWECR